MSHACADDKCNLSWFVRVPLKKQTNPITLLIFIRRAKQPGSSSHVHALSHEQPLPHLLITGSYSCCAVTSSLIPMWIESYSWTDAFFDAALSHFSAFSFSCWSSFCLTFSSFLPVLFEQATCIRNEPNSFLRKLHPLPVYHLLPLRFSFSSLPNQPMKEHRRWLNPPPIQCINNEAVAW